MTSSPETISCGNCTGACCRRNTTMRLSEAEVEFHRAGGTKLKEFLPAGDSVRWGNRLYFRFYFEPKDKFEPKNETSFVRGRAVGQLKPGQGLYGLESDCSHLVETVDGHAFCDAYEDPNRPDICSEFKEGSEACGKIRDRYGVNMDTEEINLNLVRAALEQEAVVTFQK